MTHSDGNSHPIITEAKIKGGRGDRRIWDLYEGTLLIGWTASDPALPGPDPQAAGPFAPSCQQYGTGRHVIVTYSSDLKVS